MSRSITAVDETEFPPALWRRSGRPLRGQIIRAYLVVTSIVGATLFLSSPVSWILAGVALALGLAVPHAVELYLEGWARRVRAADKQQANAVLEQLRDNRWIRNLAPNGWLPLQEGILQMHRHDGRAAAKCFEQVRRLAGRAPSTTSLVSAQAHALVLAGDRKPARDLLQGLVDEDALSARDRLDLGLLLLQESGSNREALAYLQQAAEQLGEHPRVLAGLALAERKVGAEDEAYAHFVAADEALRELDDPVGADVLKRARKALRARIREEQKQARETESTARAPAPQKKKDRKKDRRRKKDKKRDKKKDKKRGKQAGPTVQSSKAAKPSTPSRPVAPAPAGTPAKPVVLAKPMASTKPAAPAKPVVPPPVLGSPWVAAKTPIAVPVPASESKPKAPLFAPPSARKPAAGPSPLFSPPKAAKLSGGGSIPAPPPVVPPPPKLGALPKLPGAPKLTAPGSTPSAPRPKTPVADDGWGDALASAPPPPAPPAKTPPKK